MRKSLFAPVLVLALTFSNCPANWAQSKPFISPDALTTKAPAGSVVNGLALSARTDKGTYLGGEAITLKIALINSTASYQYRPDMGGSLSPFGLFDFEVKFSDEGKVSFTAFGEKKLKRSATHFDPISIFSLSVPPGKAIVYQVIISRLFDMSRGGTYWITARWHDPFADDSYGGKSLPTLASNLARVRVEEPAPEFYGDSGVIHH